VYRHRVIQALSDLRTRVARLLEEGTPGERSRIVAALGLAHGAALSRSLARPARLPPGARVVTVGGATLGGSGKTRVAVAVARELASHGARVALVGHGYRSRLDRAVVVMPEADLEEVGDEALACARALARTPGDVRVVVGPSRQAALDLAVVLEPRVDVLVIDGPLQLAPEPATLSLLALDAHAPWGAGRIVPAGDLRAPVPALLAAADHVVRVDPTPSAVRIDGIPTPLASLASASTSSLRLGWFSALARPRRLEQALASAGIRVVRAIHVPDHGPVTRAVEAALVAAPVDRWLATEKCAEHLRGILPAAVLWTLEGACILDLPLREALRRTVVRTPTPCLDRFGASDLLSQEGDRTPYSRDT